MQIQLSANVLRCGFENSDDIDESHTLGIVNYSTASEGPGIVDGIPTVGIHTAKGANERFREVWSSASATQSGRYRGLCYGHDGEYLFCAGSIPGASRYRELIKTSYQDLLALTVALDYPYIFRMWNFISHINSPNGEGMEVYRDFCQGRAEAFETHSGKWTSRLSAATGIGALGDGLVFYCIASRSRKPVHIESPRQVPAYQYPRQYGPRSPSFARASYLPTIADEPGGTLYLSGTASVIGHATAHPGDLAKQCDTTLENIHHLLTASPANNGETPTLKDLRMVKVYVRDENDIPFVRERCAQAFVPSARIQFLNVDICRADLLLEIEGIADI
jgi:chorismatase